ncbi:uncharacterized protein LOC110671540 [Hevea brasiliensis]|uniref:uncharacterized protein LOC110671540 n=1 Tax=Hevea brasiliensis TaxID=3981 RepID=UPI002600F2F7|nr:uncharacterized protein LOC110671540 [Hevea brasiliensis]
MELNIRMNLKKMMGERMWRGRFTWTAPFLGLRMSSSIRCLLVLTICGDIFNNRLIAAAMTYWRPTHAEKPHSLYMYEPTEKTQRNRSEVKRECGLLFPYGGKWRPEMGNQAKQSRMGTKFQIIVEDIREGVLVSVYFY